MALAQSEPQGDGGQQNGAALPYTRATVAVFVFLITIALFPFTPEPSEDIKFLLIHVLAGVMGGTWLIKRSFGRTDAFPPGFRPFDGILIAWMILYGVALLQSPWTGLGLVQLSRLFSLTMLYFGVSRIYNTPRETHGLFAAFVLAMALSSVYAFFQRSGLDFFPWDPAIVATEQYRNGPGTLGNPNVAAHALTIAIPSCIYLASSRRSFRWFFFLALLFLAHLWITANRSSILALGAAALFVASAAALRRMRPVSRAVAHTFIVVLVVATIAATSGVVLSKVSTGYWLPRDASLVLRYNSFYSAAEMATEGRLSGYGPGSYTIANPPFWTPFEQEHYVHNLMLNAHPHNEFLALAIHAGPGAAALYCVWATLAIGMGLYLYFGPDERDTKRFGLTLCALSAGFLVDSMFGFNLTSPVSSGVFLVLTAVLAGVWHGRKAHHMAKQIESHKRITQLLAVPLVLVLAVNIGFAGIVFASRVYTHQGRGALDSGRPEAALGLLASGERLAPWDDLLPYLMGQAFSQMGDYGQAQASFARALARNPNFIAAELARGEALFNLSIEQKETSASMREEAAACARRALELCAGEPRALSLLGRIALVDALQHDEYAGQMREQKVKEAERYFINALHATRAESGELYLLLATAETAQNHMDQAEQYFLASVALDGTNLHLWAQFSKFAWNHRRSEAFQQALLRVVREIERKSGRVPPPLEALHLAWSGTSNGAAEGALLLARWIDDKDKLTTAAWAAPWLLNELDRAALEPMVGYAYLRIGTVVALAGELVAAEQAFSRALPLLSEEGKRLCLAELGPVLARLGKRKQAQQMLRDALKERPQDPRLRLAYADVLAIAGEKASARLEYMALLQHMDAKDPLSEVIRDRLEALTTGKQAPSRF